jgi:glycolate oxidase iron-sulfur subunit
MADTLLDLTRSCIRCGFCLESCPTFQETGDEAESPRGRISLIRRVEEGLLDRAEIQTHLDTCVGCRACETACPSGVRYGKILEYARAQQPSRPRALNLATRPTMLKLASGLRSLGMARVPGSLAGSPESVELPSIEPRFDWPPLGDLPPVRVRASLLTGCAMRTLFPNVHDATRRTLRRLGIEVDDSTDLGCCGSLHAHQGWLDEGHTSADQVAKKAGGRLIVVNSAGCGGWLKECGVPNVLDITEVYLEYGLIPLLEAAAPYRKRVTYHDACHLAHGQRIRSQPRDLLEAIPGIEFIPLANSDRCCGSAGIYSVTQPAMAHTLRDAKWATIEATGAEIVAMGNPGCHAWLAQASRSAKSSIRVMHTAEVLECALSGC